MICMLGGKPHSITRYTDGPGCEPADAEMFSACGIMHDGRTGLAHLTADIAEEFDATGEEMDVLRVALRKLIGEVDRYEGVQVAVFPPMEAPMTLAALVAEIRSITPGRSVSVGVDSWRNVHTDGSVADRLIFTATVFRVTADCPVDGPSLAFQVQAKTPEELIERVKLGLLAAQPQAEVLPPDEALAALGGVL